jgi:Tfp pilus assembly protein PilX
MQGAMLHRRTSMQLDRSTAMSRAQLALRVSDPEASISFYLLILASAPAFTPGVKAISGLL